MGFTRSYDVRTSGKASVAPLVDCVNVKRTPKVRDQILEGTFHRVPDPAGGGNWITVKKPFGYVDLDRRQYYLVRPRNERHTFRAANKQLMRMVSVLPTHDPRLAARSRCRVGKRQGAGPQGGRVSRHAGQAAARLATAAMPSATGIGQSISASPKDTDPKDIL